MKKESIKFIKNYLKRNEERICPFNHLSIGECYELYEKHNMITTSSPVTTPGFVADTVYYRNCPTFSLERVD